MRALITGITGQDGSYLAELLLGKGYEVFGLVRRSSVKRLERIESFMEDLSLVEGDLTDQSSLDSVIHEVKPDEVYNMAAQSFVPASWNQAALTGDVTGLGVIRILEAIRKHHPQAKFLQASSSEMFGKVQNLRKRRRHLFIRAAHMAQPRFLVTTSPSITGKATIFLHVRRWLLITNRHVVARNL